jgi:protease PrsW
MILPSLLVLAVVAALSATAFLVFWLDRYTTEPVVRLVLVAFWGVLCPLLFRLAGPTLGLVVDLGPMPGTAAALPTAWVLEELLLAAGLAVLATSHYLEGPLDGAVYGTVAGLGFAMVQNLAAFHDGLVPPNPSVGVLTTLVRAAATAAVGAGIGFAKLALRASMRVPCALATVLVAGLAQWLLLHAAIWGWSVWGPRNIPFDLALIVAAALFLAGVFQAALALERRVLTRQLADEVALGVLPSWVVAVLPSFRRRIRSAWWRRRDERREIVRLLISLAFRKHRLRGVSEERARLYGLEVGRLRQRARTLLALAPDTEPGASSEL